MKGPTIMEVALEFGSDHVTVRLPDHAHIRRMTSPPRVADPAAVIARSLTHPIGTAPLAQLAAGRRSAAIVVSDHTRPVPYHGPEGILRPVIKTLKGQDVPEIRIIVATGTHRAMGEEELRAVLDESAFQPGVRLINHRCDDPHMLRSIGGTSRTPDVTVNRHYLDAELKIVTGLVEPHFMAGYSGGRKAICPGITGLSVAQGFHSAGILDHPNAASLVLEGNPCHEEALQIARMAGVDFCVNATIDPQKHLTGCFAGHLEESHTAAVRFCRRWATIGIEQTYDLVVTHTGHVGMNHYQSNKAAVEACRAVKKTGRIILLAHLCDRHPLGTSNYRKVLALLAQIGPAAYRERILAPDWSFTHDQWGAQMWAQVFCHLGEAKRVYTCAPRLAQFGPAQVPETNVAAALPRRAAEAEAAWAQRMLQQTLDELLARNPRQSVLVLPDGPYAVPVPAA